MTQRNGHVLLFVDRIDDNGFMNASEAVLSLRLRQGLSREEFAQRLDVSAKMIQRIEGGQQPTAHVLVRLADIARDAGVEPLADLFDATRRANMSARVKPVEKTERVRRVALSDLKYWSAYLYQAAKAIEGVSPKLEREYLLEHLRHAAWVMHHVRDEIEIPIAEQVSIRRIEEDQELLRSHKTKRPYELQGADSNAKKKTRKL